MTQTQSNKANQALESVYKSLGGTGSTPDVAQFRTTLQNASPQQVDQAHQQMWREIITPLAKDGQPIPTNVIEQCSLVADRMHQLFTESAVGAGSGRSSS
jgi:hypothetical protein